MTCHICKETGERECDPALAEIKCEICGYCNGKQKEDTDEPE